MQKTILMDSESTLRKVLSGLILPVNLVAMETANNCIFFSCIWFIIKNLLTRLLDPLLGLIQNPNFSYGLSLRGLCIKVRTLYL